MIHYNNQSYLKLSKNPMFHERSKHIEIKYHFIKDRALKGVVKLQNISNEEQLAEMFTKPLWRASLSGF